MGLQVQAMVKITQRACAEQDKRLRTEPGQRLMCVCCGGSGWVKFKNKIKLKKKKKKKKKKKQTKKKST